MQPTLHYHRDHVIALKREFCPRFAREVWFRRLRFGVLLWKHVPTPAQLLLGRVGLVGAEEHASLPASPPVPSAGCCRRCGIRAVPCRAMPLQTGAAGRARGDGSSRLGFPNLPRVSPLFASALYHAPGSKPGLAHVDGAQAKLAEGSRAAAPRGFA